jgi:deoxyribonuclease V
MGLATHLGILLDRPTIGCAKSILIGTHRKLATKAGSWTPLIVVTPSQETIGAAVRTRDAVKPVYVSQGHRISLQTAIQLTLQVCDGVRIPRPTREADKLVSKAKRQFIRNS